MDIAKMLSQMDTKTLEMGLKNLGLFASPDQIKQMEGALKNINSSDVKQKLSQVNLNNLQGELQKNPGLAKQLAGNPEVMQKINEVFSNNKK